jgi:hypothetical protein
MRKKQIKKISIYAAKRYLKIFIHRIYIYVIRWPIVVVVFSYPVEFEIMEVVALDRVEFELVVVGGIGASRNATAVCIGNDITPIVRPIRANVIVETNTIINVVLSLISTRKVMLDRLKYFEYMFRVLDRQIDTYMNIPQLIKIKRIKVNFVFVFVVVLLPSLSFTLLPHPSLLSYYRYLSSSTLHPYHLIPFRLQ